MTIHHQFLHKIMTSFKDHYFIATFLTFYKIYTQTDHILLEKVVNLSSSIAYHENYMKSSYLHEQIPYCIKSSLVI